MPLDPAGTDENPSGEDDNDGPHCRNCHTGASSCDQCHGATSAGVARGAYSITPLTPGKTPFQPGSYAHVSASSTINAQCIDGGFSYPHRTLGYNMLKDEIWGVDFDGTPIAVGVARGTALVPLDEYAPVWGASHSTESTGMADFMWGWTENGEQREGQITENLDSVCIDCHGDSTYWNGDDAAGYSTADGWDLLFKGLP